MRKTQILLITLALLLCSAVAVQAQGVYNVVGAPNAVREGGGAEMAGNVVLIRQGGDAGAGTITVDFSAPLTEGIDPTMADGTVTRDADDDSVVMVALGGAATRNVYNLTGIRLDVSEATLPITATVTGDASAIVSGVVEVVNAMEHGVELKGPTTVPSLLTRGGDGSKQATVTLTESFRSAWNDDTEIVLTVSGIPKDALWGVWHVQTTEADGTTLASADVSGTVTLQVGADGTATEIVTSGTIAAGNNADLGAPATGGVTGTPGLTADGKDIVITVLFDGAPGTDENSLALEFGLETGDMAVAEGMVTITAAFGPKAAADTATNPEFFAEANATAAAMLFTYEPASCTLLFPYAVSLSSLGWNTGIAVTNPGTTGLDGGLTFMLYMNGAEMPMMYSTDAMTPGALNDDGMLESGNTYSVLLSEVLAMAGHDGDFTGHFTVKADFTGCRGVGWVTDFSSVNQAYLAYFGDSLDEKEVPANQSQ